MDVRNVSFISSVEQDISRVSKLNERDILFKTRSKFHISEHSFHVYSG